MSDVLQVVCLAIIAIVVVVFVVAWIRSHYLEVQEGYVVPIKLFGRHRRVVCAGPHVLWPGERQGERIETRPRDWYLEVPDIRTHKGLPVTVALRYRIRFEPQHMQPAELYYPQGERTEQQRRLFMDGVQRVIEEFPRPVGDGTAELATLAAVFSPFFSSPPFVLSHRLQQRVTSPLSELGIELIPETLIIDRLDPPADVASAYDEMVRTNFEATAVSRFVETIRAAAPDLSAMELAQLYNSILNNVSEVRTIFADGGFRPGLYFTEQGPVLGQPSQQGTPRVGYPAAQPEVGTQYAPTTPEMPERNYPLTTEDMALLKPLPD
jgi:regulator of protease activity HflC (stomatin/prohibitin superfamily)